MKEQEYLDFLTVWGEQFADVMMQDAGAKTVAPQDAYEIFVEAFRKEPLDHAPIAATCLRKAISLTAKARTPDEILRRS